MRYAGILLMAAAAAAMPSAATSQDVPREIVEAMAGDWLLAPEDGRPGCRVTLGKAATIGGYEIVLGAGCETALPAITDVAAWRLSEDGLVLADALRATVLTLAEDESANYTSRGEPGERLVLVKSPPGIDRLTNARDVFGAWSLLGADGPANCAITLLDSPPPGGEESFGLTLGEGCAGSIAELKLASWRVEGLAVMLYGTDGESLVLGPDGKGGFVEQGGEAGTPRRLVRK